MRVVRAPHVAQSEVGEVRTGHVAAQLYCRGSGDFKDAGWALRRIGGILLEVATGGVFGEAGFDPASCCG
jgi:hypothetical protein